MHAGWPLRRLARLWLLDCCGFSGLGFNSYRLRVYKLELELALGFRHGSGFWIAAVFGFRLQGLGTALASGLLRRRLIWLELRFPCWINLSLSPFPCSLLSEETRADRGGFGVGV